MPRSFRASLLALAMLPPSLPGAQAGPAARAAESITEADVRQRVGIIADDSMGGRDTPSRGLDRTALYIATEFHRFGLVPAGDSGSYIQRYPLSRVAIDTAQSMATFASGGRSVTLSAARDLVYISGPRRESPVSGGVVLLASPTAESVEAAPIEGKVVVVVGATQVPTSSLVKVLQPAFARRPAAIVIVSPFDSIAVARQARNQARERVSPGAEPDTPLMVSAWEGSVSGVLQSAGVSVTAMRRVVTPVTRDLPVTVTLVVTDRAGPAPGAPNVVGILRGTDPVLRDEYIVFSAHMDHEGTNPSSLPDSIFNGADDDASGTAGILELAEAFSMPGARPRRSLIFLTVSGEEKGLWGSDWFAGHPPVPITQVVADINLDMIGRNWKDTIAVIGKEHSDLGATLSRVNAAHPELRMQAVDDLWPDENFYFRSDHYNFARRGVPILFFFNGTHADYHQPSDSPDRIDAEKEARILRLAYWLGREVANATERPRWNAESRKRIVGR